jgi:hypothetical protein
MFKINLELKEKKNSGTNYGDSGFYQVLETAMLLPTQHIEDNGIFKEDKFYIKNNNNKNTFLTYLPNKEERK